MLRKQGRAFLGRVGNAFGRGALFSDADFVRFHEIHGFLFAEPHALGVTFAEVAFEDLFVDDVEAHGAEGTNRHAGTTTDANIVIDRHGTQLFIFGNGFDRANIHARRVLALLAGHGNVQTFMFPFHNPDAAAGRVGNTVMFDGAHELAKPATRTFFMIDILSF